MERRMSNLTLDQIRNRPDEDQESFHRYVQKSLRRRRKEIKDKTEREQDATKRCS